VRGIELDASGGKSKEAVRALATLARMGDEAAREVVENCGKSLGMGLANLVDIFNPARIVLHGAITEADEVFFSSVTHCLRQHAFLTKDESIELVSPTFGDDAGLVGAAAVALDAIVLSGRMREGTKVGVA
jgi:predicted NBD/HSP70 family sugar kinase